LGLLAEFGLFYGSHQFPNRTEGKPHKGSVHIADYPRTVNDEHAATRYPKWSKNAVLLGHRLINIGEKRKGKPVLARKLIVTRDILR
jgi:hypothetical protein